MTIDSTPTRHSEGSSHCWHRVHHCRHRRHTDSRAHHRDNRYTHFRQQQATYRQLQVRTTCQHAFASLSFDTPYGYDHLMVCRGVALQAIPFFKNVVVREVLIALRQWHFKVVPPDVRLALQTAFQGFQNSAVNEVANNVIKDHLRDMKGTGMGKLARFILPHAEGVLATYERDEIEPNPNDRIGARPIPNGAFDALGQEPSVLDSDLRKIIGGAPSWPSYTAQSSHSIPSAMSLLMHMSLTGDWGNLPHAWLAVLFVPGTVVERRADNSYFVVLEPSPHGVLVWPCSLIAIGSRFVVRIDSSREASASWVCVTDLDAWRAWPTRRTSFLSLAVQDQVKTALEGCIL